MFNIWEIFEMLPSSSADLYIPPLSRSTPDFRVKLSVVLGR